MEIKLNPIKVEADPRITVYNFEVTQDRGVWTETFGSAETAQAFLTGMKVALRMANAHEAFGGVFDSNCFDLQHLVREAEKNAV